jgi:hypothetical protein
VAAEVFTDFIEMAEHLLEQGYKDPAAVVAGSVLEEHLRQLCHKNAIDTVTVDSSGKANPKKPTCLMLSSLSRMSIIILSESC